MLTIKSSVELLAYRQELVDTIQSENCTIFIDTNFIAWVFRLNNKAQNELVRWLLKLSHHEQLVIPAWTVHEYNYHLRKNDPKFFLPHKAVGKQLNVNLLEFDQIAHLMISDAFATELGYPNREELFLDLSKACKTIQKCVNHLAKNDEINKYEVVSFFESLVVKCALNSNIHELSDAAAREASIRYANRLSPGHNDALNTDNSTGDLIIWKEILNYCASKDKKKVVIITNDRKSDWVYTPPFVVLPNGKEISGTNAMAHSVKLPNPDLIAEFQFYTGSIDLHISTIESVIEVLSSSELNNSAQDFRHLALAIKLDARTPTDAVVQWFLKNPDKYTEALHGICRWERCPSEVDQKAFEAWTVEQMKDIESQNIQWLDVFCELFL